MLTTKQILKAARLENQLGYYKYPRNQRYDEETMSVITSCNSKYSIDYVALSGEKKTLPLCEEDYGYIMRESDKPRFYARKFLDGERLLLLYNSSTKELAREIELPYPCKMLDNSKYYFSEYLKKNTEIPSETDNMDLPAKLDYTFTWEVQNKT